MAENKIKILFISSGASIGGAALCLLENVKRLDKDKYQPLVVIPHEGPLCELLQEEAVRYRIAPLFIFSYFTQSKSLAVEYGLLVNIKKIVLLSIKAALNAFSLSRIIREERPDAVIINSAALSVCGITAKLMGKRIIWHVREVILAGKSAILRNIIIGAINCSADKVICASEFSRRNLLGLGINKSIEVVYDGAIDLKRFNNLPARDEDYAKLGLGAGNKIVGFVGQIYKAKGWHVLLKAAFAVSQKIPDVRFIIIGSGYMIEKKSEKPSSNQACGSEEKAFRLAVEQMRLSRNFIFLGQRFDPQRFFPLMDCFVFPVVEPEVFGRVMVEAMACAVAVVASDIGAVREVVVDKVTGLLVKPEDSAMLSEAIIKVLNDEHMAKRMGEAGRKRAEELFDMDKVFPGLLKAYGV